MNTKVCLAALSVAVTLGACGGGGEGESSQTASNTQTRSKVEPADAIDIVEVAQKYVSNIYLINRFLKVFAPAANTSSMPEQKEVGFASCNLIFTDPNCKGRFRFETEFPLTQAQQAMAAGSTFLVDWESIDATGLVSGGPVNSRWTFKFIDAISLVSAMNGQFEFTEDQTLPTQYLSTKVIETNQLNLRNNSTGDGVLLDGEFVINPHLIRPVDVSERITFKNWVLPRSKLQPGAQIVLYSTKYSDEQATVFKSKFRLTITVVSSDEGRTEFRVIGKSDADDLGTTRTVIGTLDSDGKLVYTAS